MVSKRREKNVPCCDRGSIIDPRRGQPATVRSKCTNSYSVQCPERLHVNILTYHHFVDRHGLLVMDLPALHVMVCHTTIHIWEPKTWRKVGTQGTEWVKNEQNQKRTSGFQIRESDMYVLLQGLKRMEDGRMNG